MTDTGWFKRLCALGLVGGLVSVAVVALQMFSGGFTTTEAVVVTAPRSGLVLNPDAKVKMRGVEVGRVKSVSENGDEAVLTLAMKPGALVDIPANAGVDIRSSTVFGAKFVNFVDPAEPSSEHLEPGARISASEVTVEVNTLFQNLSDVLTQIEPEKLNATLGAIATALRGRGEQIGDLLETSDEYLKDINPSLPALQRDLAATADVTALYGDVAPDLLHSLENLTKIGETIVEKQDGLDSLLLGVTGLSRTAGGVLTENEHDLTTAIDLLEPTTALLDEYSPAIYCLIVGLDKARPKGELIEGGLMDSIIVSAGATYGAEPYSYPNSLPKVNATGGPNCAGLPEGLPNNEHAPFVVTDTGNVPFMPRTVPLVNSPKVFQFLYAGLYPGVGP